jgi:hypothetical protein
MPHAAAQLTGAEQGHWQAPHGFVPKAELEGMHYCSIIV